MRTWISHGDVMLFIQQEFKQLDMSKEDEPLQDVIQIDYIQLENGFENKINVELSPNVFEDNKDWLGLSDDQAIEETKFLALSSSF